LPTANPILQTIPSFTPFSAQSCIDLSENQCKENEVECKFGESKEDEIYICVAKKDKHQERCKKRTQSNGNEPMACENVTNKNGKKLCKIKKVKNSCSGCHPLSCKTNHTVIENSQYFFWFAS